MDLQTLAPAILAAVRKGIESSFDILRARYDTKFAQLSEAYAAHSKDVEEILARNSAAHVEADNALRAVNTMHAQNLEKLTEDTDERFDAVASEFTAACRDLDSA